MSQSTSHARLVSLIKAALIAALYIILTLINPLSYGAIQFRLSETLNCLAVFNKRYIWALTLGCAIANINSSLGAVDLVFGTLQTLVMTSLSWWVSRHLHSTASKLASVVIICTLMSWVVALELFLVTKVPFWMTYLTVGLGELGAMVLGAIIFWLISKRIDLSK